MWCTRFLEVLACLDLPHFADWGVKMMVSQIGDQSVKVRTLLVFKIGFIK